MRWFGRSGRKGGRGADLSAGQERMAERIAGAILCRQRSVADYLNGKVSGVSFRCRIWWLVGFCLVFGLYFGWLLVRVLL